MRSVRLTILFIILLAMSMPSFHGLLGRMIAGNGYREGALAYISANRAGILKWAQAHDVPALALAAVVADQQHIALGSQMGIDWIQDQVMLPTMPQWSLALDFEKGYDSPWFNLAKHAVGPANIPIADAIAVFDRDPKQFPNGWRHVEIAKHLATADGTFQVVALQLRHIKQQHAELQTPNMAETEKELRYISAYFSEERKADVVQQRAETERLKNYRTALYEALYE